MLRERPRAAGRFSSFNASASALAVAARVAAAAAAAQVEELGAPAADDIELLQEAAGRLLDLTRTVQGAVAVHGGPPGGDPGPARALLAVCLTEAEYGCVCLSARREYGCVGRRLRAAMSARPPTSACSSGWTSAYPPSNRCRGWPGPPISFIHAGLTC